MSNTIDQLQRAKDIVDRFNQRGGIFPREYRDCGRHDPVRQQGMYNFIFLFFFFLLLSKCAHICHFSNISVSL